MDHNKRTFALDALSGELLSSSRIGNYMAFAYGMSVDIPDDPSWVWSELSQNPWLAMAVYRDLEEKDAMIASALDARKSNVLSKSRHVVPASEKRQDAKAAEFIEETLEGYMGGTDGLRFGFSNFLYEALDAIGKGVAIGEIIYGDAGDRIYINDVKFKPQHLFHFGEGALGSFSTQLNPQTGPLRLRQGITIEGLDSDAPLPEKKFFVHTFRPYQGNRWGSPVCRKVYWPSWFKRAGVKQWLRFLEKGSGTVLARYDGGASADEQLKALQASQAVAEEPSVAVPKKFEIEMLENVRQAMGSSQREFVDDFCNNEIVRMIRGQTLTSRGSEGGGSRALGQVHERGEEKITESDSISLMLAVNTQLVFPLTFLNQGPVQRPPIWTIKYEPGADLKLMSEVLYRMWQMKLPLAKKPIYVAMQLPEPSEGDDLLEPPSESDENSAPPGGEEPETANFAEAEFISGVKKKSQLRSGNTSPRPPVLKRERFANSRRSTTPSSSN